MPRGKNGKYARKNRRKFERIISVLIKKSNEKQIDITAQVHESIKNELFSECTKGDKMLRFVVFNINVASDHLNIPDGDYLEINPSNGAEIISFQAAALEKVIAAYRSFEFDYCETLAFGLINRETKRIGIVSFLKKEFSDEIGDMNGKAYEKLFKLFDSIIPIKGNPSG